MNVNKGHKQSPLKSREQGRAAKPIERVPTKKLIDSIKQDIERAIQEATPADKPKKE